MKTNYYTNIKKASTMLLGLICLSFLVPFSSCKKDDERAVPFALKDNPSDLSVSSQGASQTFDVQTTGTWKIEPLRNERWLKIEPTEGQGDGTFTVTVDRNMSLEPRQSVLTFVVDGKVQNNILKIEQAARSPENGNGESYVNLDGLASLEVPEDGLHGRYAIRSTGEWRVEIIEGSDWFSMEPMQGRYDTGVNVSVDVNLSPDPRTARLVYYLNGEQVPGIFEVNQEGVEVILYEDFNWLNYGSAIFYTTTGETRMDSWTAGEKAMGWSYYQPDPTGVPSVYARPGFLKLGRTNYGGEVLSPKLSAVEGTQNLRVSFKAVPYQTAAGARDVTILKIGIIGPGTLSQDQFDINNWPNYTTDPNCTEIWKAPETTRTFTITGATAETQIWFLGGAYDLREGSGWTGARNVNRIFLDDILVTVLK
ncbi:Putative binding domain-containing protein, N-terminal [Parapedobacter composti]|uniref:Putative binding domain-containing protein, N-terminal n=1 Tax=Parapedobacter composti TaxID=623281 RepID=A0A1I1JP56_9SPHI|nr:BACON domain-containing carbohydrate-binding protein [Parapedobacter composti]SFC48308.1 Putative binding domain-containing protein, N-terminal [Parapedobacter composti]